MKLVRKNLKADIIIMFDFDTVQTDALVNRRGFPLCAKISYLHSSLQILTIRYTES